MKQEISLHNKLLESVINNNIIKDNYTFRWDRLNHKIQLLDKVRDQVAILPYPNSITCEQDFKAIKKYYKTIKKG